MAKMLFRKAVIKKIMDTEKHIAMRLITADRLSLYYEVVFEHNGKKYIFNYVLGASELQDTDFFEHAPALIECWEAKRTHIQIWRAKHDPVPK